MTKIFYLVLAFFFDLLLGIFLPTSFVGYHISASPNVLLIALILITYKEDVFTSLIYGFLVGFLLDLHNIDTIFTYSIIYLLITLIVSAWSTRINDTFFEMFSVTLAAIFVKEVLIYISHIVFNNYVLNIETWASFHLTFTILYAIVPIIIGVIIKINFNKNKAKSTRINKKW